LFVALAIDLVEVVVALGVLSNSYPPLFVDFPWTRRTDRLLTAARVLLFLAVAMLVINSLRAVFIWQGAESPHVLAVASILVPELSLIAWPVSVAFVAIELDVLGPGWGNAEDLVLRYNGTDLPLGPFIRIHTQSIPLVSDIALGSAWQHIGHSLLLASITALWVSMVTHWCFRSKQ
jgi:hypothetical protein